MSELMKRDRRLNSDQRRIAHIADWMDGFGEVDFHEQALKLSGGNEPTERHYYEAIKAALDAGTSGKEEV